MGLGGSRGQRARRRCRQVSKALSVYCSSWLSSSDTYVFVHVSLFRSLSADKDIFIYSGHNAGDKLFVQASSSTSTASPAPPLHFPTHRVCYLYGCSSVKMARRGVYDPQGSVMHHLLAGTQCVVGKSP